MACAESFAIRTDDYGAPNTYTMPAFKRRCTSKIFGRRRIGPSPSARGRVVYWLRPRRWLRQWAELAHKRDPRSAWHRGEDSPHTRDLFHQKYRGSRDSFGYPACPNLEDETKLFALLDPHETIGVQLTTGFLLEPEHSTSAIVVIIPRQNTS